LASNQEVRLTLAVEFSGEREYVRARPDHRSELDIAHPHLFDQLTPDSCLWRFTRFDSPTWSCPEWTVGELESHEENARVVVNYYSSDALSKPNRHGADRRGNGMYP